MGKTISGMPLRRHFNPEGHHHITSLRNALSKKSWALQDSTL
jgi:hypothetical protein